MSSSITLFISMFTTLLAMINPLEAIPIFLGLMEGKDSEAENWIPRDKVLLLRVAR
jgi:multiple antibiotic resistance protein